MGRQKAGPGGPALQAVEILGAQIRAARIERGYTQDRAARVLATSRSTVNRMEHGSPDIAIGRYFDAAIFFGIDLFDTHSIDGMRERLSESRLRQKLLKSRVVPEPDELGDIDVNF